MIYVIFTVGMVYIGASAAMTILLSMLKLIYAATYDCNSIGFMTHDYAQLGLNTIIRYIWSPIWYPVYLMHKILIKLGKKYGQ